MPRSSPPVALLIAVLSAGCGEPDGVLVVDYRCEFTEQPIAFDATTMYGTPEQIRDQFLDRLPLTTAVPLRWGEALGGEPTTIAIELVEFGAPVLRQGAETSCGDMVLIPATLRLRTTDGVLDITMAGDVLRHGQDMAWSGELEEPLPAQLDGFRAHVQQRLGVQQLDLQKFSAGFGFPGMSAGRVSGSLRATANSSDWRVLQAVSSLAEFGAMLPPP